MSQPPRTEHRLGQGVASKRDLQRFAKRIREGRAAHSLSQSVFARQIGVSNKQLSNVECGNNWPAMPVALKICRLLKIELPRALDREEA
jgi:DNA-binding XRE family transcriptional regulator